MTLLGELYANGFGVPQNDVKAAKWYKLAADRGDANAMFALAMFNISGRGGLSDKNEAVRLLAAAAKLGNARPPMISVSCISRAVNSPRTLPALPNFFAPPPRPAARRPHTPWRSSTEGRGVPKDDSEATRLLGCGARR